MKKTKIDSDEPVGGVLNAGEHTEMEVNTADTPAVVFKDGFFYTADGARFNTRLKAEKHLQ